MPEILIGVDVGTTFLKAAAFDPRSGRALARVVEPLNVCVGRKGEREQSPLALDRALRAAFTALRRRLGRLDEKYAGALQRLRGEYGWGQREVLTMASIIEKEARHHDERPAVASVYYNRLTDPDFTPPRRLQADPTAGYGCLIEPVQAPSCADYRGRVTPAMLRDPDNRYNTYLHDGLPPGPIANPGEQSIEAALAPARTDYRFFVAQRDGRHSFSRTLEEHNRAIRRARNGGIGVGLRPAH